MGLKEQLGGTVHLCHALTMYTRGWPLALDTLSHCVVSHIEVQWFIAILQNTQNGRSQEWRNEEREKRIGMGIGIEITIKLDIRPVPVYCGQCYIAETWQSMLGTLALIKPSQLVPMDVASWVLWKACTSQLLSVVTYPVCNITVMTVVRVDSPEVQLAYDFPPTSERVS